MLPVGKALKLDAQSPEQLGVCLTYEDDRSYEYNLATLLEFRGNLAEANAKHAAWQQFWEALAVDLIFRSREFEEQGYAKWWAHSRRYARYLLRATSGRETIETLRDWVILTFSEGIDAEAKKSCVQAAWKGLLVELKGSESAADKAIALGDTPPQGPFGELMYTYWDLGWTYEAVMRTKRLLDEQAEKAKSIAKIFQDRSFRMHEFTELEKAKYGNVGPITVDELVNQVASRLGQGGSGITGEAALVQRLTHFKNNT